MRSRSAILAAAVLLPGCTPVEMRHDQAGGTCDAAGADGSVKTVASLGTIEALRRATHSRTVRVVRPGEMVTSDFRADRLTVTVDAHGIVDRVVCG